MSTVNTECNYLLAKQCKLTFKIKSWIRQNIQTFLNICIGFQLSQLKYNIYIFCVMQQQVVSNNPDELHAF